MSYFLRTSALESQSWIAHPRSRSGLEVMIVAELKGYISRRDQDLGMLEQQPQ